MLSKNLVLFILSGFAVAATAAAQPFTAHAVSKANACDWLQEVKRTNTWFERDQNARKAVQLLREKKRTDPTVTEQQLSAAWDSVVKNDRVLQSELDDLVGRCGWPTTSGYGDKAPQYAAFIVQHAALPYQEKYLPMMQAAADAKELAPRHVAMLVDRILMHKKLPQRYGTQLVSEGGKLVVYRLENPRELDKRRAAVAMVPASFCAYLAMFEPTPQSALCNTPTRPKSAGQ